jgi:predicted nucleic acid-binding protein
VSTPVRFLLDTSAIFALLDGEDDAERVRHVLQHAPTYISALSLLEVDYITLREHNQAEADMRHALLKRSGAEIVWELDEPTVLKAAAFKAQHRLSFAEAAIAATAYRYGAILLDNDPEFDALGEKVPQERLPLKAAGRKR